MKRITLPPTLCVFALALGCDAEPTGGTASPMGPSGAKSDGVDDLGGACISFHHDYVDCQDNAPADFSCEGWLSDEHPEAAQCCAGDDGWAFCDLGGTQYCHDVTTDHAACVEMSPADVACDEVNGADFPLSELCGLRRFITCDDMEAEYLDCGQNAPANVSCDDYITSEFPGGDVCCGADAYEHCAAY